MADPTPAELRSAMARLLGWKFSATRHGVPALVSPDGHECDPLALPDPANDLNAMAAVEAALRERGLIDTYLNQLRGSPLGDVWPMDDWSADDIRTAATAPASVRALAAYRVLAGVSRPDASPRP